MNVHRVTGCFNCPFFHGNLSTCYNENREGTKIVDTSVMTVGVGYPDNCPLLKEESVVRMTKNTLGDIK